MFNHAVDSITNAALSFAIRKYQTYPPAKTAVLFVNAQAALTHSQQSIVPHLRQLAAFARSSGFQVIHAPYAGHSQRYPSPGQVRLTNLLSSTAGGAAITAELGPESGDVVLEARSSLSAFSKTTLKAHLQQTGVEHLVVAGPYGNLALDSTVRDAAQFDYHVTLVWECVGTSSDDELTALKTTLPRYAHTTTDFEGFEALVRKTKKGKSA